MTERRTERLAFCKMEGAGNDFILLNGAKAGPVPELGQLARRLCARRTSVGADGLILVEPSERPDADIRLRFWNPDGHETATCGNGTRCAARFTVTEGLAAEEMLIDTEGSDIAAHVSGDTVTLHFSVEPALSLDFTLTAPAGTQGGHHIDIGNPHFVMKVESLPEGPIEPMCRPLRYAPELGGEGANVHLVEVVDRHRARIRSYERGVEAETLACGSGSVSSAVALCAAGHVESPVEMETRSGDVLTIRFQRRPDGGFSQLELEGPARFVYRGELSDSHTGAIC
jgi:diaminopimelate epimerase